MALLSSEIQSVRYHLGYNLIGVGAEPFIPIVALFETIIQNYITSGASTTSSTPVTAATTPTPQTLTLASASGVTVGDVLIVDVDARQERSTIQNLSGASATVLLSLAHSGTYPCTVEGGESVVRDILRQLRTIDSGMNGSKSALASLQAHLGIKRIEGEIEWFGGGNTLASQGRDPMSQLLELREFWRDELASALGVTRLNARSGAHGGGGDVSVY